MYDFNLLDGLYIIEKKNKKRKKQLVMVLPFVIVLLSVVFINLYFYHFEKMYEKDQIKIESLIDKYSEVDAIKARADELVVKKIAYEHMKDNVEKRDVHSSDDLIALKKLIPNDLYLYSYKYIDAYTINITGQSDSYHSVVNLLYEIRQSFYFDEGNIVSLTKSQEEDEKEIYNFNITIYKIGRLKDELQVQ